MVAVVGGFGLELRGWQSGRMSEGEGNENEVEVECGKWNVEMLFEDGDFLELERQARRYVGF
jgi:hypothetical protein